jgi:hypothetical protein
MRNLGKVLGPVIGGIIMTVGSFDDVLVSAGSLLLVLAGFLAVIATVRRTRRIIRL